MDASLSPCALTIGNFDGVHRGHRALLEGTVTLAHERGIRALAMTFDPHPVAVLAPERAPQLISSLRRRLELMDDAGLDAIVLQPFDREFARIGTAEFVARVLGETLRARVVAVGPGFRYGAGRAGTTKTLEIEGEKAGIEVVHVPPVFEGGKPISSSRIRALIAAGSVEEAGRLLGHPVEIVGEVVPGCGRGRQIGVPTANLELETAFHPPHGVYAGTVDIQEGTYRAVTNIGNRPTLEAGWAVEAHLIDFEGDLYGRRLVVRLARRLRPERRFPSVDALREQIHDDIAEARRGSGGG